MISSGLAARILAEAAARPDQEICGLLFGDPANIADAVATDNVAEAPATRFEIDPAALLAAHRRARGGGPPVIGCYHSHPTGRAEPSRRDAANAVPDGSIWLIAAGDALTAWRAVPQGAWHGRFDPLALHCVDGHGTRHGFNEENR